MKKQDVVLHIDTSISDEVLVAFEIDGSRIEKKTQIKPALAQMVLPLIDELLKDNKLTIKDITEIKVHTGPGSFTGLRVGIAVANTLGTMLQIPVNDRPIGALVFPLYSPSKLD